MKITSALVVTILSASSGAPAHADVPTHDPELVPPMVTHPAPHTATLGAPAPATAMAPAPRTPSPPAAAAKPAPPNPDAKLLPATSRKPKHKPLPPPPH